MEPKRLYLSRRDRKLAGVCGGIAEYLGIDSGIVRVLWVLFAILGGGGVIAYIIIALLIKDNPYQ